MQVKVKVKLRPSLRLRRWLARVGVVGPILFVALSVIAQALEPDFDPIRQTVSSLVLTRWGWLQNLALLILGVSLLALDAGLFSGIRRQRGLRTTAVLLALAAVGLVMVGIFPTDPPKAVETITGRIHFEAARGAALLFLLALFLLVPIQRRDARWRGLATYTLAAGVIAFVLELTRTELVGSVRPWSGLHERLLMANGLVWIEAMSFRLLRITREERRAESQAASSGAPRQ